MKENTKEKVSFTASSIGCLFSIGLISSGLFLLLNGMILIGASLLVINYFLSKQMNLLETWTNKSNSEFKAEKKVIHADVGGDSINSNKWQEKTYEEEKIINVTKEKYDKEIADLKSKLEVHLQVFKPEIDEFKEYVESNELGTCSDWTSVSSFMPLKAQFYFSIKKKQPEENPLYPAELAKWAREEDAKEYELEISCSMDGEKELLLIKTRKTWFEGQENEKNHHSIESALDALFEYTRGRIV